MVTDAQRSQASTASRATAPVGHMQCRPRGRSLAHTWHEDAQQSLCGDTHCSTWLCSLSPWWRDPPSRTALLAVPVVETPTLPHSARWPRGGDTHPSALCPLAPGCSVTTEPLHNKALLSYVESPGCMGSRRNSKTGHRAG